MRTVTHWLTRLYLGVRKLQGPSSIREVSLPSSDLHHLTGVAVGNYELKIYCQKKHFVRQYTWWPRLRSRYVVFRVFSNTVGEAPAALQKVCGYLDVVLPPMAYVWVSDRVQKDVVVQAYLDILADRVRQELLLRPVP